MQTRFVHDQLQLYVLQPLHATTFVPRFPISIRELVVNKMGISVRLTENKSWIEHARDNDNDCTRRAKSRGVDEESASACEMAGARIWKVAVPALEL